MTNSQSLSILTFVLACFRSLCLRLPSTRLRFDAAEGFVALRGLRGRCIASSFFAIRSYAASRLADCERRSVAVTTTPVGRCVSLTPVSTLLRCCPPGPPATKNSKSQSRSNDSLSVGCLFINSIGSVEWGVEQLLSFPTPHSLFSTPQSLI